MKVCAMLDRSAGNSEVGDMWTETKSFDESATLASVLEWAEQRKNGSDLWEHDPQLNVCLSILQEE